VHAVLKNPYRQEGGGHHSGNKMALANVRERLALHFDAEASLASRVTKDGYEVHIRMPYRTVGSNVAGNGARGTAAAAAPSRADGGASRRLRAALMAAFDPRVAHG